MSVWPRDDWKVIERVVWTRETGSRPDVCKSFESRKTDEYHCEKLWSIGKILMKGGRNEAVLRQHCIDLSSSSFIHSNSNVIGEASGGTVAYNHSSLKQLRRYLFFYSTATDALWIQTFCTPVPATGYPYQEPGLRLSAAAVRAPHPHYPHLPDQDTPSSSIRLCPLC